MSDLSGAKLAGNPFAIWSATMQVMPGGVLDTAFGRFFVGVTLQNGSASAWPVTNARLSARSRRQLQSAGLIIDDTWSTGDAQAFDQQVSGNYVVVPALAAGDRRALFFKVDASLAHPGVHDLEIEFLDPAAPPPAKVAQLRGALRVAQTKFDAATLSFVTTADKGVVTTSIATATFDVEALRRALGRARTQLPPAPGPSLAAFNGFAVFGAASVIFGDRVKVVGATGSNASVTTGDDGVLTGDVIAGGDIVLDDRASVTGALTAGGVVRKGNRTTTAGPIREHAGILPLTIPARCVGRPGDDVTVASGTRALAPGVYGVVQASTSSKASLSFVAGVYEMRRLTVGAGTTLNFDVSAGPIEIRTVEALTFGDRTEFYVSGGPSSLIEFYSDAADQSQIGTDIDNFAGTVVAPNGTIHVESRTTVHGSLLAKAVDCELGSQVLLVPGARSWLGVGASGLELMAYPIGLDYTIEYGSGFFGTAGPPAFDGLAWKTLLANVNLMFNLALGCPLGQSLSSTAADLVIGRVHRSVLNALAHAPASPPAPTDAGSVDAATLALTGNRALGSPPYAVLDAQTGEANAAAVSARNDRITWSGAFLKNAEIAALLAAAASDPDGLKVHKSGAVTGVTRGLLAGLLPIFDRPAPSGSLSFVNQLSIAVDPAFPSADGQVAGAGDSGALWIHTRTGKAVALEHAIGTAGSAVASRIEDVVNALGVTFA